MTALLRRLAEFLTFATGMALILVAVAMFGG